VAAALVVAALFTTGCDTPKKVDRGVLLGGLATCTVERYKQALAAADMLVSAADAHAANPNDTTRAAARTAWERAIDAWQVADVLRYGPLAAFDTVGGKGLREPIYSWPDVNRCLTDEQLVSKLYEGAAFPTLSNSTRGLAAVEYLLFYTGSDNGCPPASSINTNGSWAALPAGELAARKAAYARAAATDVAARIREVIAAWEPNGFTQQLTTAGRGSTLFVTQQLALSAAGEALFYFDTDMKDPKLGMPLGIVACPAAGCPEGLESPWADRGKLHLQNNLAGVETLLLGCEAGGSLGFVDLLESIGAPTLVTELRADLAAAHAAFDAIPGAGLKQALASDRPSAQRLFEAIKELTDFLKMEFKTALQLSGTRVEGDHD
jgi:predicted lipoprotein